VQEDEVNFFAFLEDEMFQKCDLRVLHTNAAMLFIEKTFGSDCFFLVYLNS
jgi:hypothetical protein